MHVFLIYFGLPGGAVWSNVLAEPVCFALAGVTAVLLRDRLGRLLAGWWHKHHGVHTEKMLDQRLAAMKAELLHELKERPDPREGSGRSS